MNHFDPALLQRYATALGDDAIDSLAERDADRFWGDHKEAEEL